MYVTTDNFFFRVGLVTLKFCKKKTNIIKIFFFKGVVLGYMS